MFHGFERGGSLAQGKIMGKSKEKRSKEKESTKKSITAVSIELEPVAAQAQKLA